MTPEQERVYLAHVNATCPGCELCDEDLQWEAIWNGPTAAQVKAVGRSVAAHDRAASIAAYRVAKGLPAHLQDATVWDLMFIEHVGRGGR